MRNFLRRLTVISLVFALLLGMLIILSNLIISKKASFKIAQADTMVIFGHSHPECAYNDTLITGFKNLSSSGEAYFYTFSKIKNVIAQNPQIKTVFIEFSNNQVAERMDEWIWGNDHMELQYPIYAPFITLEDQRLLIEHNFRSYINSTCFALKKQLFNIAGNNYAYTNIIGGYYYNQANTVDSLVALQRTKPDTASFRGISKENLRYLKASIDLCQQHGKQVYLVRTPTHHALPVLKNEDVFQEVRRQYFGNVPFLDFAAFPVKNAEYADLEHLNCYGARRFSTWFEQLLKGGLLSLSEAERTQLIRSSM